ncbi:heat-shock protein Hsp20 [Nocardioides gansuensis]|uniref:Heat-shock protein Hsp20 n=1 Tax=Nocardioides gansuensis TaxID=2138300 RepID=A0A2T8FDT6_9ACTN|nr:Hsp20/alpha crystallin family protein [Nocardioides gansuensis]PVG83876.1 heat-shock protein Hsp20 [Nocardioides gansuensis]
MVQDTNTALDRLGSFFPMERETGWDGPMDVRREDERFVVQMDVPGVDPGAVDVSVEDGYLTVRAERSSQREDKDEGWVVRERSHHAVVRRLALDDSVDVDAITADLTDGVLTLTLPLAAGAKPRKVSVAISEGKERELGAGSESRHHHLGDVLRRWKKKVA